MFIVNSEKKKIFKESKYLYSSTLKKWKPGKPNFQKNASIISNKPWLDDCMLKRVNSEKLVLPNIIIKNIMPNP